MTATRAYPGRGASPRIARTINDRLALRLLQQEGPLTAGQLKEFTGMSRPSVADLLERLQDAGLIAVVGESGEVRRGPNARVYGIVASRAYVAGLDVRIESVAVEIADLLGRTVARAELPVAADADPARLVEDGVELLRGTARSAGVGALHTVAFGAPGLVDPATGRRGASVGLPAWHPDLADALRERLGVPVLLENEVNLAAVAELRAVAELGAAGPRCGERACEPGAGEPRPGDRLSGDRPSSPARPAGEDDDTFVLLWIGGGVGAAVVLDGRLRRGASGGAGEVGFLPLSASGALPTAVNCDNGYHGMVGSRAVCALARAHAIGYGTGSDDARGAAAAVRAALGAGPAGEAFLGELAGRIALGVSAVCSVLDPGRVVLAGEVGQAGGEVLAALVAERFEQLSPLRTRVRPTAVPDAPILRGAVLTAMDAAQSAVFAAPAL